MNKEEKEIWKKTYEYFLGKQYIESQEGGKIFRSIGIEDASKEANAAVKEFRRANNEGSSKDDNGSYVILIPGKESTHAGLCKVIGPFETDGRASSYIRNYLENSMAYVKELRYG